MQSKSLSGRSTVFVLFLCILGACSDEYMSSDSQRLTDSCSGFSTISTISLTDLNLNPVSSITPGTSYKIRVVTPSAATCLTLTGGAMPGGDTCLDTGFSNTYVRGDVGFTSYRVISASGSTCPFTGHVTPLDDCGAPYPPQYSVSFTLPPSTSCGGGVGVGRTCQADADCSNSNRCGPDGGQCIHKLCVCNA